MLTRKLRRSKTELQHKQCEKTCPADHRARKRDAKRNTSVNDSPINFLPGTPAPNQPGALNVACEQQTHFRSSLLSLRYFSEGEKRRSEMRLLFAGYPKWEAVSQTKLLRLHQSAIYEVRNAIHVLLYKRL